MVIPVVIESIGKSASRASGQEPFAMSAEGATREESVQNLRRLIETQLPNGQQVELIEINPSHPWAKFAGTLRDDPLADAWEEAMREYRRMKDEEPDIP